MDKEALIAKKLEEQLEKAKGLEKALSGEYGKLDTFQISKAQAELKATKNYIESLKEKLS